MIRRIDAADPDTGLIGMIAEWSRESIDDVSQSPKRLVIAIAAATAALEVFIHLIAPAINVPLNPVSILTVINATLFGGAPGQYMLISSVEHWVLALVIFPVLYVVTARRICPGPAAFRGIVFGTILGLTALFVIVPSRDFGIGSGTLLIGSMYAHVGYGVILAVILGQPSDEAIADTEGQAPA